jgi:hypothetical protein
MKRRSHGSGSQPCSSTTSNARSIASAASVRACSPSIRSGLDPISDADVEALFMTPFPSRRYDEKSFPGLWPAYEPRLRKEPFSTLDEMDRGIAGRAVELCMNAADKTLGVLSLSASIGEQMWAYYADDHRGIAIGFEETHPFFGKEARPIVYSDETPRRVGLCLWHQIPTLRNSQQCLFLAHRSLLALLRMAASGRSRHKILGRPPRPPGRALSRGRATAYRLAALHSAAHHYERHDPKPTPTEMPGTCRPSRTASTTVGETNENPIK